MPIAAFEAEPQAKAAASALRDLGFDAEVILRDGPSFDERTAAFFQGRSQPFEAHAIVVTNAETEPFTRAVQRHYGTAIIDAEDILSP
jgi:hypothetical protein